MATDSFKEITHQSFGSRLAESIKGVVIGTLLFVGSFILLWWNEGNILREKEAFNEMGSILVEGDSATPNSALDGKLLHLIGSLSSTQMLGDDLYLKAGPYLLLERQVEMYQWTEQEKTETKGKVGGSDETIKTYSYRTEWRRGRVDSSNFKKLEGHENPPLPVSEGDFKVQRATFGVFDGMPLLDHLLANTRLSLTADLLARDNTKLAEDRILIKRDPQAMGDQVGDVRISYYVLKPGTFSAIARQVGSTNLEPYTSKNGKTKLLVSAGARSAQEMLAIARTHAGNFAIVMRFLGFFLMWIGLVAILAPFSILLDVLPLLGTVSRGAIALFTLVIAASLSTVTIIVGMVAHNPIVLATVVVLSAAGIVMWLKNKTARNTRTPVVQTPN